MSKEWDVIEVALEMFGKGNSEKAVAVTLHERLIFAFGLNAGAEAEFEEAKRKSEEEFEKRVAAYWRGRTQEWKDIFRLPRECLAAYRRLYIGEDGDKLKGHQIKELYKANREGGTKFAPTDEYREKFQQFVSE